MEKIIKIKNIEYSLEEFEKKFKQENWFQKSYNTINELNSPKKEASMLITIIGNKQKKYLITTKYVEEMYGLKFEEEEKQYLDPKNQKYCNTESHKKEHKVTSAIDIRKIRSLQKKAFAEKYGSNSLQYKKEKRQNYNNKLNFFLQTYSGRNSQKDYEKEKEKYKHTNLEKCLKQLERIADILLDRESPYRTTPKILKDRTKTIEKPEKKLNYFQRKKEKEINEALSELEKLFEYVDISQETNNLVAA